MIAQLDRLLRALLMRDVASLRPHATVATIADQIRFQPPDADWKGYLSNLTVSTPEGTIQVNALNVYLFDVRENRKLRSNEVVDVPLNGSTYRAPAPARIDCHYYVTAWSPGADVTPSIEPALDEHFLLYETIAALMRAAPLNAARLFPFTVASTFPPELRADLPTQVLPVDGFTKQGEFWQAMATDVSWKPGAYVVVTLPVVYPTAFSGEEVRTITTEHRVGFEADGAETLVGIGGRVRRGAAGPVVPRAWIYLETAGGEVLARTESDRDGRFTFFRLTAGAYRLRAGAAGAGADLQPITVPSPTGEYDLHLS